MKKLNKDITFIYMDNAEKAIYQPIAEEASRRGYQVKLTDDKFAKCEIGVYCQHINFPQFSKFSVIMLHDIIQQYGNWPDLWLREPWNKYDIGILPSKQWVENWGRCSQYYYANPRIGMYQVGWPKADRYAHLDKDRFRLDFNAKHRLDNNKKTILYAPSWENDGKQDDFVQAMLKLGVNILVKQATVDPNYSPSFHDMYEAILEMKERHKDIPGVTILDPGTNIFEAILACDVLVSDESSTMCEAVMMGIPAVSVSDWLIPDVSPKRFPQCDYDFVYMTKKANLKACVSDILNRYDEVREQVDYFRLRTFGEVGGCAEKIMDILDDCIDGRPIRYEKLASASREKVPFDKYRFHVIEGLKREVYYNYKQRSKIVSVLWNVARGTKRVLTGR